MASTVIRLDPKQLADWYRRLGKSLPAAARRGAIRGALRAVQTLQKATGTAPPANPNGVGVGGAVNTGYYKRAWKHEALPDGARVYNAAPYAGVIEHGRRIGRTPPLDAIQDWAQRRLGLSRKEAKRAAFPIARAIAKRGLVARKVLENSLPGIEKDFIAEVQKELETTFLRGGGGR